MSKTVTGATGLIGRGLIRWLSAPHRRFALITRYPEKLQRLSENRSIRVLVGDITLPQLGFDRKTYAELARCTTEIIHCAADTRFGISLDFAREVNVAATQHVLNFVSNCSQLKSFAYVSTVYVIGRCSGHFAEELIHHDNGFLNAYQQSKYEAEARVARVMADIPAAIFRLSSVMGDSNGIVHQFNHVHRLIRLFPQNVLPVVPGYPDAPIDLIASDWAVPALAYLFESAFVPSRVYHLCAGSKYALTLREMIQLTISVFENHPAGHKFLPLQTPKFVTLARYEEFVQQRSRDGDRLFNELVRVLGYFLPHLAIFQAFDNSDTMRDLALSGLHFPATAQSFERVVKYCLDTNWGKADGAFGSISPARQSEVQGFPSESPPSNYGV
jgi:nucleoside-diphosphate-sugar epimerase